MTTMAGRRLRQAVLTQLAPMGVDQVVIAGLSNAYAGYLVTREEYAKQDYEGASTHFGPWQLAAVQQETEKLAVALRDGTSVAAGPTPRDLRNNQTTLQTGVVFDDKPLWVNFGSVDTDANASYTRGQTVSVRFWGGPPEEQPAAAGLVPAGAAQVRHLLGDGGVRLGLGDEVQVGAQQLRAHPRVLVRDDRVEDPLHRDARYVPHPA